MLPKALLTVSVHTGDRVFEIKGVVDPGVRVSEVRQLLVGSPAVCVDGCCPLTPSSWYDETPVRLPFSSSQNPILHSGCSSAMLHPPELTLSTNIKYKQVLEPYSSFPRLHLIKICYFTRILMHSLSLLVHTSPPSIHIAH